MLNLLFTILLFRIDEPINNIEKSIKVIHPIIHYKTL